MQRTVFLFILATLQSILADNGICLGPHVVEKHRYVMDRVNKAWIYERYNDTIYKEVCCSGYEAVKLQPLLCSPICDPKCENSDCVAPDTCVCHPGHVMVNNSSSSCYDVCDSCVFGVCVSVNAIECTCYSGYQRHPEIPHICEPVCFPDCANATCTAPSVCECYDGHKPHSSFHRNNVCIPHCTEECVFGECTEPDVCTCFENYINDKESPSICLPECNNTCVNGVCSEPDTCKCREGFVLHPRNPYHCIPWGSEDFSSNYCQLTMHQAVKYDKYSDCFLLKDQIVLSVPPDCKVIQSQTDSFCSQQKYCHHSECLLNFRCSAFILNGTKEIHCDLEEVNFEIDVLKVDHITDPTDWTDIVIVVNSFRDINSSTEIKENITKKWTLQPSSKWPVCGRLSFAVELSECEFPNPLSQESSRINSSVMFWMNVFLVCGFLLLVGAGVGGFLWTRHRRLNDPLNYRGDMMQRFYNNECYENQPNEMVSDDDSQHFSDETL